MRRKYWKESIYPYYEVCDIDAVDILSFKPVMNYLNDDENLPIPMSCVNMSWITISSKTMMWYSMRVLHVVENV
jgi:sulfate adenylyltransferase subunit 1 (EFTu-like GTPase family)